MRNASLLHEDLEGLGGGNYFARRVRDATQDFKLYKEAPPLVLFNLHKEEVKVPGMDRVLL